MKRTLGMIFTFCLVASALFAETFPLWGDLKPGAYAVGFTTRFQYDYSRTFRLKYSFEGKRETGNRARPIQIAIWYPAQKSANSTYMIYEEYVYLIGRELAFDP